MKVVPEGEPLKKSDHGNGHSQEQVEQEAETPPVFTLRFFPSALPEEFARS